VIVVDHADRYAGIVFVSDTQRETAELADLTGLHALKRYNEEPDGRLREGDLL
jgi:hypothetical protein